MHIFSILVSCETTLLTRASPLLFTLSHCKPPTSLLVDNTPYWTERGRRDIDLLVIQAFIGRSPEIGPADGCSAAGHKRYQVFPVSRPYFANLPMTSSPALRPTLLPAAPAPAAASPITPAVSPNTTRADAQPYADWLNRGLDPCGIKSGRPAPEVAACLSKLPTR